MAATSYCMLRVQSMLGLADGLVNPAGLMNHSLAGAALAAVSPRLLLIGIELLFLICLSPCIPRELQTAGRITGAPCT